MPAHAHWSTRSPAIANHCYILIYRSLPALFSHDLSSECFATAVCLASKTVVSTVMAQIVVDLERRALVVVIFSGAIDFPFTIAKFNQFLVGIESNHIGKVWPSGFLRPVGSRTSSVIAIVRISSRQRCFKKGLLAPMY